MADTAILPTAIPLSSLHTLDSNELSGNQHSVVALRSFVSQLVAELSQIKSGGILTGSNRRWRPQSTDTTNPTIPTQTSNTIDEVILEPVERGSQKLPDSKTLYLTDLYVLGNQLADWLIQMAGNNQVIKNIVVRNEAHLNLDDSTIFDTQHQTFNENNLFTNQWLDQLIDQYSLIYQALLSTEASPAVAELLARLTDPSVSTDELLDFWREFSLHITRSAPQRYAA